MEGVWRKGVSKNRLYEVSAPKIPSTKFCEGFWDFVAVSSPTGPPFHELSTNSLGFYECPAPSTMLVEQDFGKHFLCTTLPFASELSSRIHVNLGVSSVKYITPHHFNQKLRP